MKKIFKKILIISVIILGSGLLFVQPTKAGVPIDPLVVQFQNATLFNETNFLPGNSVTRWIKVTNNSGSTQKIITEAINKTDSDNFSEKLNLVIKEGATVIFNDTLKEFFDSGEVELSDLNTGTMTQYDFTITFDVGSGDAFQNKLLGFDILIGFQGQEGFVSSENDGMVSENGSGSGSGNGVVGLTIYNEALVLPSATSVTITWTTSYPATSQVVYGTDVENHILDLSDNAGNPPLYGYAHTTPETDLGKVTSHTVVITGLTPGTVYYYRAISHGSLAITREYQFTTQGNEAEPIAQTETETIKPQIVDSTTNEPVVALMSVDDKNVEVAQKSEQNTEQVQVTEKEMPSLLASIFNASFFSKGIIIIIIIVVIALIIYLVVVSLKKKKAKV